MQFSCVMIHSQHGLQYWVSYNLWCTAAMDYTCWNSTSSISQLGPFTLRVELMQLYTSQWFSTKKCNFNFSNSSYWNSVDGSSETCGSLLGPFSSLFSWQKLPKVSNDVLSKSTFNAQYWTWDPHHAMEVVYHQGQIHMASLHLLFVPSAHCSFPPGIKRV